MATNNGNAKKSQDGVQPEVDVTNKSIIPHEINQYILETSVYPTEPKPLKEIRELTNKHPLGFIASSPDVLQLLGLLIKLINAKNTIEVGVFTGHSVLASALALPSDGKILALDITSEHYEMGLPAIQKAGVEHKIDFKVGAALPFLNQLVKEEKSNGKFDFAFVDADKGNYLSYHKRIIELVKVGGLIAYDNTLWCGSVTGKKYDGPSPHIILPDRDAVVEFNKTIAVDPRVEICQISIGDGLTLCRRIS